MIHEIKMPKVGQTVDEVTITAWLKEEGDLVEQGEPLVEVATDKVTMEVESFASGTLRKILVAPETVVQTGEVIAYIGGADDPFPEPPTTTKPAGEKEHPVVQEAEQRDNAAGQPTSEMQTPPAQPAQQASKAAGTVAASPLVKRIAKERCIDLAAIKGTGPGGRITREDLDAAAATPAASEEPAVPEAPAAQAKTAMQAEAQISATPSNVAKISAAKKLTGEKMTQSFQNAPHFYVSTEVDVSEINELRRQLKRTLKLKYTVNTLLIKACAMCLKEFPLVNSSFHPQGVIKHDEANLGLAVASDDDLFVPVVKDADEKTIKEIDDDLVLLVDKARSKRLLPDDLAGGTFTISNLGMYDITEFTAIINPPQSAILAVGKSTKRPIVDENGDIVARHIMKLTLSSDHRIIDGALAARFISRLKEILEKQLPDSIREDL